MREAQSATHDMVPAPEFPFAVYTATYGYGWSNVPAGLSREDLSDCYRLACAAKPQFLEEGQVVSGSFARGGLAVAFSIQLAKGWDVNGRDAEYGAFAFIPQGLAPAVDLKALLARPEFLEPMRRPPRTIAAVMRAASPASPSGVRRHPSPEPSADAERRADGPGRGTPDDEAGRTEPGCRWPVALAWLAAAVLVAAAVVSALTSGS